MQVLPAALRRIHPPPRKPLCGSIPGSFLEPLVRSWSHFRGIYRQKLTRSLKIDFEIPPRRALRGMAHDGLHSLGGAITAPLQAGSEGPRTSKEVRRGIKTSPERARLKTASRLAKVRPPFSSPCGATFGTFESDRRRVGYPYGGGTQDKKISKDHLPRVVYHQLYNVY